MGQRRFIAPLLALACATSGVLASKKVFNIHDDLLAFPQFQVLFPESYVLESQARELLQAQASTFDENQKHSDKNPQVYMGKDSSSDPSHNQNGANKDESAVTYEEMTLEGQRYLCQIPHIDTGDLNRTRTEESSEVEKHKELARATDRGLELLRDMEGKCMYYISGWWSYSFCYKKQIKQFHALPFGSGVPNYPPMEDPTTQSFILGRFRRGDDDEMDGEAERKKATTTDLAELQTKGGSRYLVQRLEGGTKCDLTGRNRKVEIQFHCNPQSTDRIGWIKELTTCSYLMVIYTPRLCNDVAFLPPQQDEVHSIECREVLTPEEVPEWEAMQNYLSSQQLVESGESSEFAIVGDIQVGAQKLVGTEGKKIEKGRVASAGEEKVDVVAKREKGEVQWLSKEELKKYDLDPQKIETLKKQLEELANGKDWTLEVVEANGERGLRGIVDADEEDELEGDRAYKERTSERPGTKPAPNDGDQPQRQAKETSQEASKQQPQERPGQQPEKKVETQEQKEPEPSYGGSEKGSEETFKDEL
ncbi:hypothetical protein ASPWEDRAFT_43883 [Aspergillus wentii DTO 134E9]|uniref:Endoplasmic reticulum lectin n=1 Tax=Aspergillus wentii DTO 134E9 TaxID=1073089 RepID=A0A1L9RAC8_ASPWE|nr:uncharacterized protein ASPWEDRAFT_43883 [Aspergillus wentii DTO 134E9]KAI9934461.1 Protein OS-9 [Aspergillus wentii]OJJ31876.1 hypothetical protein ASPWEDRAFT_43883 [Aspergillus wentii DTO 134E9]